MPEQPIPKWLPIVFLCLALLGFADSAYLTAEHVRGVLPPCVLEGCEQVLSSAYAAIGPVPVAALGALFYGALLVLLVAYFDTGRRQFLHWFAWVTAAGFLGTLYFLSVQAFILHAFCQYCLLSAATSTTLFGLSVWLMRRD